MHPRLWLSAKSRRDFAAAELYLRQTKAAVWDDVPERQLASIQTVWADAIRDIPYYAGLVTAGRAPEKIETWDDFRKIPVLTRQILQSQPENFFRRSRSPQGFAISAGSTGVPLRIGMDQHGRDLMRVMKMAAWIECGYTAESKLFLIWGHAHLLGTGLLGRFNHWKRMLADALLGYERVNAYSLNRVQCQEYACRLIRQRPTGVIGYASALDIFARYNLNNRDHFRNLGVKFVLSTAEPMPNPDTRVLLEDMFNCSVVEEYGGAEFGQVAFKRGSQDFEVYSNLVYLESFGNDSESKGDSPLLLTTLYQRYLPLIRYSNGDAIGTCDKLANGHIWRFPSIAGRKNDEIQFDDGSAVHSVAIFHCMHQEASVKAIQMVLGDAGVEMLLVSSTPDDPALITRMRKRLSQVHPELASAKFSFVEDVMTNRAGKRRWFVDRRTTVSLNRLS